MITIDAVGFAHSRTGGRAWSFDLAAESVLVILDVLAEAGIEGYSPSTKAVVVGDSMGGGPTGLRVLLRDQERVDEGMAARVLGTVACGTAAEVESEGTRTSGQAWERRILMLLRQTLSSSTRNRQLRSLETVSTRPLVPPSQSETSQLEWRKMGTRMSLTTCARSAPT